MKKTLSILSAVCCIAFLAISCGSNEPQKNANAKLEVLQDGKPFQTIESFVGEEIPVTFDAATAAGDAGVVYIKLTGFKKEDVKITAEDPRKVTASIQQIKTILTGSTKITISAGDKSVTFIINIVKLDLNGEFLLPITKEAFVCEGSFRDMYKWRPVLLQKMKKDWVFKTYDDEKGTCWVFKKKGKGVLTMAQAWLYFYKEKTPYIAGLQKVSKASFTADKLKELMKQQFKFEFVKEGEISYLNDKKIERRKYQWEFKNEGTGKYTLVVVHNNFDNPSRSEDDFVYNVYETAILDRDELWDPKDDE